MTLEEAKKVARIVGQADTCCTHCAYSLMSLCEIEFPEFVWSFDESSYEPETWVSVEVKE